MNLIRKLKINEIEPVEFSERELNIINFINSKISNLTEFKSIQDLDATYYMNYNGEYILEQNNRNDVLWCRYHDFWEILELEYSIDYKDIILIIHYIVENAFKMKVSHPYTTNLLKNLMIEKEFFKLKLCIK